MLCKDCEANLTWPSGWQILRGSQLKTMVGYVYSQKWSDWLFSVKEKGRLERLKELRHLKCWESLSGFEAIVGCPADPHKIRVRGYDFARIFVQEVSHFMKVSDAGVPFLRMPFLSPQKTLNRKEREHWLGRLVTLSPESRSLPKRLLLVDDVLTTGVTLDRCATLLQGQGYEVATFALLGRPPLVGTIVPLRPAVG